MPTKSRRTAPKQSATYDIHKLLIRDAKNSNDVSRQISELLCEINHTQMSVTFLKRLRLKVYDIQRNIDAMNMLITEAENEHKGLRKKVRQKVSRWN